MIQRIQTLYLAFTLALSIALFFLPLSEKVETSTNGEQVRLELRLTHMISDPSATPEATSASNLALTALNLLVAAGTGYIILMYKKRSLQIRVIMMLGFLVTGLLILVFLFSDRMGSSSQHVHYLAGIYLLPIQIFALVAARRAILRDERLVRSADRIR